MPGDAPDKTLGKPKVLFEKKAAGQDPALPPSATPCVLFPASTAGETQAAPDHEKGGQKKPTVLFGTPKPVAPQGEGPKVLAGGMLRKRIPCTANDLQQLDATANAVVLARALRIVQGVNLDDPHFEDIVRFGSDLQAEHGAIAEAEFVIANDSSVQQGQTLLANMLQIFKNLDPEKVFAVKGFSIVQALSELAAPKRTPRAVFEEKYPQLLDLVRSLKTHEGVLAAAAEKLAALKPRYAALIQNIASYTVAANFIVRYVRENQFGGEIQAHYAAQADALETRITSLLATQATLEMGRLTHEALAENVRMLISAGRGMLEEDLPAFHTAYTAALAATQQYPKTMPKTTLEPLRSGYLRVIHKLQGAKS